MSRDDLRSLVAETLGEILDRDCLVLTDATVAADVPGWDSLSNLKLLVALESACGVKFQLSELDAPANVGELLDLITAKGLAKG